MFGKGKGGYKQRALAKGTDRSRSPSPLQPSAPSSSMGKGKGKYEQPLKGGARQRALSAKSMEHVAVDVDAPGTGDGIDDFRTHVAKLFCRNRFSGPEALKLFKSAKRSSTVGIDDLAKTTSMANSQRDVWSKLKRANKLPAVYLVEVPVYDHHTRKLTVNNTAQALAFASS